MRPQDRALLVTENMEAADIPQEFIDIMKEGASLFWDAWYACTPDNTLLSQVVAVLKDMKDEKKYSNDTQLPLYKMGELRAIQGFWLDKWFIEESCRVMISRGMRFLSLSRGIDPTTEPGHMAIFAMLDRVIDAQVMRVAPKVLRRMQTKFPTPELDVEGMKAFRAMYEERLRTEYKQTFGKEVS